jgi:hypothetical protein
LPPELDLHPFRERRTPWVVLCGSITLHVLLLAFLMFYTHVPTMVPAGTQVRLAELPQVARTRRPSPVPSSVTSRQPLSASARAVDATPRSIEPARAEPMEPSGAGRGDARGPDRYGRIGPAQATGRVWVQPLPLPPRELAERLTRSHSELADSAVTAIIQAFLDSIATDPATRSARPPDWTTTLAGAKFGLDSRWIYVAGLKIPTALLALLPIPAGGNDQKAFDRSEMLYRDLRQAAQRAANVAEFKQAIKDIRQRKEAERQFDKNQRTPPSPDLSPEDPPK